jgi:hypothetical protein
MISSARMNATMGKMFRKQIERRNADPQDSRARQGNCSLHWLTDCFAKRVLTVNPFDAFARKTRETIKPRPNRQEQL